MASFDKAHTDCQVLAPEAGRSPCLSLPRLSLNRVLLSVPFLLTGNMDDLIEVRLVPFDGLVVRIASESNGQPPEVLEVSVRLDETEWLAEKCDLPPDRETLWFDGVIVNARQKLEANVEPEVVRNHLLEEVKTNPKLDYDPIKPDIENLLESHDPIKAIDDLRAGIWDRTTILDNNVEQKIQERLNDPHGMLRNYTRVSSLKLVRGTTPIEELEAEDKDINCGSSILVPEVEEERILEEEESPIVPEALRAPEEQQPKLFKVLWETFLSAFKGSPERVFTERGKLKARGLVGRRLAQGAKSEVLISSTSSDPIYASELLINSVERFVARETGSHKVKVAIPASRFGEIRDCPRIFRLWKAGQIDFYQAQRIYDRNFVCIDNDLVYVELFTGEAQYRGYLAERDTALISKYRNIFFSDSRMREPSRSGSYFCRRKLESSRLLPH